MIPESFITKEEELIKHTNATLLPDEKGLLAELLYNADKEKRQLRIKLGIDPTSTDLHLGHTVSLQLLKKFQELGHLPVLIIGGFTATVGDPSGRNEARPPLTYKEVKENAKTYLNQVGKILDVKKTEILDNYEWLSKLSFSELIKLAHLVTINQLIAKEAFGTRISAGDPLYLHETLYPLLQAYDSVMVKSDIEIGGVDQTYNILFGRHVQKHYGQKEQLAILLPLLIGLDGKRKMSKSFNNYIALNDSPEEIYGKAMSIPDDLILHYFKLVTNTDIKELTGYENELKKGKNPRDIKMILAKKLVSQFYSSTSGEEAESNFIKQFKLKEIPDIIPEFVLEKPLKVIDLIFLAKLTQSKAEAKRLIEGGGVKLKSNKVHDPNTMITENDKSSVLQIGKRKFVRII